MTVDEAGIKWIKPSKFTVFIGDLKTTFYLFGDPVQLTEL